MKTFLFKFGLLISCLFLTACASSEEKSNNQYRSAGESRPLVDSKYSLAADRQAMDEARSQIPDDKRKQNDEMAYILQLFAETKRPPADIRSQFDTMTRKKRAQFDKDITRERENFTKEERKKRENFLKDQKQARDDFNRIKQDRDKKNEFYREQDQKRSEYFADERDRRNDFESDVRERRKNFEDYIREKNNEFNQEYKAYSKRYDDMKKAEKTSKSPSGNDPAAIELEQELQKIKGQAGTPLESGE
jgi:hypothetical protein